MPQPQIETQIKNNNKKKLKHQNIKLHHQLKRLQLQIEALANQQEYSKQQQSTEINTLKTEIETQKQQIKHIKEQIETARHTNIKQNVIYIRKEEDQLVCLKKELQQLIQEKVIVNMAHQDKVRKLQQNQPLQKHRDQMQNVWAETKKQNRQLNLKMVEIEREIRKYHSIKERAKTKTQGTQNQEQQLTHLELEIQRIQQESELKSLKWKPNIDVLDNQFFSLRNQLNILQQQSQEVQKEQNIWKMRAAALRNQSELETDRARLSKVVSIVHPTQIDKATESKSRYQPNYNSSETRKSAIDQIKRRNLSLPRAQSTPNPPSLTKISSNPIQAHYEMNNKNMKSNLDQSLQHSLNSNQQKSIELFQKLKKKITNNGPKEIVIVKQQSENNKNSAKIEKKELNKQKNELSYAGLREKHRLKGSIATNLAQQIKKKTDEVKAINQSMIGQSKKQSKQAQYSKFVSGVQIQKSKKKNEISKYQEPQINKQSLKQDRSSSLTKISKYPQGITKAGQIAPVNRINQDNNLSKAAPQKNKQKYSQENSQKLLIENINIQKLNKIKIASSQGNISTPQPKKLSPKSANINRQSADISRNLNLRRVQDLKQSSKVVGKTQPIKSEIKIMPSSPKKQQKKQWQRPKNIAVELIDETEGIPKIVKRKKVVEGTLVNAATST